MVNGNGNGNGDEGFEAAERRGVYRAIYERRDVRTGFLPDPVPQALLLKLIEAAHHAPSVGFMQPTRFIIVADPQLRAAVQTNFESANRGAAAIYEGEQRERYEALRLAAILEAPVNLCVVCDPATPRGAGLGRQTIPETALFSTACAVENFWLAARAEGIGVGWVSILDPDALRRALEIPAHAFPVAYLCVGYVARFEDAPDLERFGWEQRAPLQEQIFLDRFGAPLASRTP
jgi:5,6-dimethylbenzimidazole synthase